MNSVANVSLAMMSCITICVRVMKNALSVNETKSGTSSESFVLLNFFKSPDRYSKLLELGKLGKSSFISKNRERKSLNHDQKNV